MNKEEKQLIYSVLVRLVDDGAALTPTERRDLLNTLCRANCDMSLDEILGTTHNLRKIQIKRGNGAENDKYTGQAGEITMDTDAKTIRIHDGQTVGGEILAKKRDIPQSEQFIYDMMPDYDNGSQKQNATEYTTDVAGWLEIFSTCFSTDNTYASVFINGNGHAINGTSSNQISASHTFIPIPRNTTYKVVFSRIATDQYIKFYPCVCEQNQ